MALTKTQLNYINKMVLTKNSANKILEDLESLGDAFYTQTEGAHAKIDKLLKKHKELIENLVSDSEGQEITSKAAGNLVEYLRAYDYMVVSFAFDPSDEFLRKTQDVLAKILSQPPMFDVAVDRTILGGVIIDYHGKHVDLSLTKYLDQYFVENRNAILSKL